MWDAGRPRAARRLFQRGAQAGDPSAQVNFGYFLDVGLGGAADKLEAMRWYRRAYRQGDTTAAANNIAILYREQGRRRLAERWFKHSSSGDPVGSALELGKLYRDLFNDPVAARACFHKVARSQRALPDERDEARALIRAMR